VRIVFSWPSEGSAWRYGADEESIPTSVDFFSDFSAELATTPGLQKVHVLRTAWDLDYY
jgi:esterase/lipase superfamily enzyme